MRAAITAVSILRVMKGHKPSDRKTGSTLASGLGIVKARGCFVNYRPCLGPLGASRIDPMKDIFYSKNGLNTTAGANSDIAARPATKRANSFFMRAL